MASVRVRVVIKPIPLSRYPLARKGILLERDAGGERDIEERERHRGERET